MEQIVIQALESTGTDLGVVLDPLIAFKGYWTRGFAILQSMTCKRKKKTGG